MNTKSIIYLVIGVIAVYLFSVYNAAKKLSFGIGKIQNLKLSNGALTFIFNLRITNGDTVSIPLTGVNVDNYFGASIIGKSILQGSVFLSGKSTTDVPLLVTIPYTDLLYLVPEIGTVLSKKIINFEIKGTVSAVGITAPLSQKIELNLKNIL